MFQRIGLLFLLVGLGLGIIGCQVSMAIAPVSAVATPIAITPPPLPSLSTGPGVTETATFTQIPSQTTTRRFTPTFAFIATRVPTSIPTTTPTPSEIVRTARVPILMYHYVSIPPTDADAVRLDLSVPPDVFDQEMKFLFDQGYQTIRIQDLVSYLRLGTPLPPKPIILTFDDGYEDHYANVFPTLKNFGFTGTFFVITGRADENAAGYLTWEQIEEMAANGMEIGTHSVDHRFNLGAVSAATQWREIQPARDTLARHLPNILPIFAYPSGSYNAVTLAIVNQLGYLAAVTTKQSVTNRADAVLELKRVRIRGGWSIAQFVYELNYWIQQK